MSAVACILGYMEEAGANPAWGLPKAGGAATIEHPGRDIALALRMMDRSARAWVVDREYSLDATRDAVALIGPDAVIAILNLQSAGKWPACGTPEWEQLVVLADGGWVRLAPVFLIGDDDYLCEEVVEKRIRAQAAKPPASAQAGNPLNLRDDLRKMGLLLGSVGPYAVRARRLPARSRRKGGVRPVSENRGELEFRSGGAPRSSVPRRRISA